MLLSSATQSPLVHCRFAGNTMRWEKKITILRAKRFYHDMMESLTDILVIEVFTAALLHSWNNILFFLWEKFSFLCKIFSLFLPCNMAAVQNLYWPVSFSAFVCHATFLTKKSKTAWHPNKVCNGECRDVTELQSKLPFLSSMSWKSKILAWLLQPVIRQ